MKRLAVHALSTATILVLLALANTILLPITFSRTVDLDRALSSIDLYGCPKAAIGVDAAKAHFVRILPVHARCSERRGFPDQSFVQCAAKVSDEPIPTYSAEGTNDDSILIAAIRFALHSEPVKPDVVHSI